MSTTCGPHTRVQEWRQRRKLSIEELAKRAEMLVAKLRRIESGRISPTVNMLEDLAMALKIQPHDLLHPLPRE